MTCAEPTRRRVGPTEGIMGIEREEIAATYDVRHGMIQNEGRFKGCGPWVPFFADAADEGRADCHVTTGNGPTVYWFELATTDVIDRLEWPELTGIRRIGIWFGQDGAAYERRVPWIGKSPPGSARPNAPFAPGDHVTADPHPSTPFERGEVLAVVDCACIATVGTRDIWRVRCVSYARAGEAWVDADHLHAYTGEEPARWEP